MVSTAHLKDKWSWPFVGVNKAGVLRGNYLDAVADNILPVYGSVDKKTQRVAWSIGQKKDIVFEAGLNNLTQEQTILLVRLEEPQKRRRNNRLRLDESEPG